jgi:nucleoside-diphosphate kinase
VRQRTFAIIKPDAVRKNAIAPILSMAKEAGLSIADIHMANPPRGWWAQFYAEHSGKGFFDGLLDFMCSGPSVFVIFDGEDAIKTWRDLLGATAPTKAEKGTIRALYGTIGAANAGHGSDSPEAAEREATLFIDVRNMQKLGMGFWLNDPLGMSTIESEDEL